MRGAADPRASAASRVSFRVRYPETDRMQVAYHAHYLVWFELGRTELMRSRGCAYGELEDRDGIAFPVIEVAARYHAPARYDEMLEVVTQLVSVGGSRVRFEYRIERPADGRLLASGFSEHAAVGRDGKPRRLPSALRERLGGLGTALLIVLAALGLAGLPGCSGKKKTAVTPTLLSAAGAYRTGMEQLSSHDLRQAIATLDRIQYSADAQERIEPLSRLAVADATFYGGTDLQLIDARNLYLDFVTLYGDHPLAPYAQTQAGMCSLLQISHPSRDQTLTYQTLADLGEVSLRYPDSRFAGVAQGLIRTARANLAESEFIVGRFYMKQKKFLAAVERFDKIADEFPEFEQMDKVLFHMGGALIKLDSTVKGRLYLEQVVRDWPDGPYSDDAQDLLARLAAP